MLSRRFSSLEHYREREPAGYRLLPLRFTRLDDNRYVVSNMVGEYLVMERDAVSQMVQHQLPSGSDLYDDLKAKHFIYSAGSESAIKLTALKYRTKLDRLAQFTGLHMFVVTLRCDYSCPYCQV